MILYTSTSDPCTFSCFGPENGPDAAFKKDVSIYSTAVVYSELRKDNRTKPYADRFSVDLDLAKLLQGASQGDISSLRQSK